MTEAELRARIERLERAAKASTKFLLDYADEDWSRYTELDPVFDVLTRAFKDQPEPQSSWTPQGEQGWIVSRKVIDAVANGRASVLSILCDRCHDVLVSVEHGDVRVLMYPQAIA